MVQAPATHQRRTPRPSRVAPQAIAARAAAGDGIPMVKLEAAGNDFLVVLDPWPHEVALLTPASVRAVCDRHRGIGADGLIVGRRTSSVAKGAPGQESPQTASRDLSMTLYNADGSEAEMSGNGIRCFVHAAVLAGVVDAGPVHVATAAGLRTVVYETRSGGEGWARVDMGPVRLGSEVESPLPGTRARLADVGNPHLVAIGDVELESLDLGSLWAAAVRAAGGPVNFEVVRPGRNGADLDLRVLERGVGETLACGTGTCAAAAVARAFGLAGDDVEVDNPGGRLEVRLGPEPDGASGAPDAELGGPVRKVADVAIDEAFLRAVDG